MTAVTCHLLFFDLICRRARKRRITNLVRHKPSLKYFARIRVTGKLIRLRRKTPMPVSGQFFPEYSRTTASVWLRFFERTGTGGTYCL